jgi:hypothetical protein
MLGARTIMFLERTIQFFYVSLALQPPWALGADFQFHDHFTDGRTVWTLVSESTHGMDVCCVCVCVCVCLCCPVCR